MVADIAGHGGAGGECERGVRLGGADEHVVERSPVGEQLLSETIVVRAGPGRSRVYLATGMAPTACSIRSN